MNQTKTNTKIKPPKTKQEKTFGASFISSFSHLLTIVRFFSSFYNHDDSSKKEKKEKKLQKQMVTEEQQETERDRERKKHIIPHLSQ